MAVIETKEMSLHEFSVLFGLSKQKYINFARRFIRNQAAAEDLVNDSFISFWENKEELANINHYEAYFYTIVKNHCLNWLRNRQSQYRIQQKIHDTYYRLLQYDISSAEDYDPNLIFSNEIYIILQQQLAKMPELTRIIFEDNRFNGMTYAEIAEKYDISVWKVTREIQAALGVLRLSLKDYLPALLVGMCLLRMK